MQRILITGSSGMVGKNIVEFEKSKNYFILKPSSKELNLLDKHSVYLYMKTNQPDIVIHCAGKVGGIQANMENPFDFFVQNAQMALNTIIGAYESGVRRFINMSSSCMYPRELPNPLSEECILKGELEPTNEGYAIAKIVSTKLCEYVNKKNAEFKYKTVIPCNLYGRYDKFDLVYSHMIPAVIKKIHDAKINNKNSVDIWGDGEARREFMYAEDLADFIYFALENFEKMPQNINVGLGHDYTINEYYKTVAEVIGYSGSFTYDLLKPTGMKQKLIDDLKLQYFGWKYKTSLRDGIKKTYEYYLKEYFN